MDERLFENYIGDIEICSSNGDITIMKYHNDSGIGYMYFICLWQGVYLWANDVRIKYLQGKENDDHFIKMNYCNSGRCELKTKDDRFEYVDASIVSIGEGNAKGVYSYPTGRYVGLEFGIGKSILKDETVKLFEDVGFKYDDWKELKTGQVNDKLKNRMDSVFKNLINQKETIEYYRIEFLHMLYDFSHNQFEEINCKYYLTLGQRKIVKETEELLTEDLSRHYTIEDIAKRYKISPSSLKKYFSYAFGKTVTAYMQEYRCQKAKELLLESELDIQEIAAKVGYSNQGKFGNVFKKIYGCNPHEYRLRNKRGI